MSMLAERKTKQKWSLNPRGKAWSQDANKFGQKMLEKMGWQQGKGLGAKQNGIVEHIKVPYKNDSKGMGYKESNSQWTEHETNFTALLESLTGNSKSPKDIKLNSLEKKSQMSRARVHYHKFARGKDLSRYSEKDLANIFGKKSLNDVKKEDKVEVEEQNSPKEKESFLINGGSMRDYFKKKLPTFAKSSGYVVGHNGVLKKEVESENEEVTFGFGYNSEVKANENKEKPFNGFEFGSDVHNEAKLEKIENKTSVISNKKRVFTVCIEDIFSPKKKLKKEDSVNLGLSNPAFNPLNTHLKVQKLALDVIEETREEATEYDEYLEKIVTDSEGVIVDKGIKETENNQEEKKKKSNHKTERKNFYNDKVKSKTKVNNKGNQNLSQRNSGEENLGINISSESSLCMDTEENPFEVKPKKKKSKKNKLSLETVNILEDRLNPSEIETKKGKAKSKNKKTKNECDESDKSLESSEIENSILMFDNPNFNDVGNSSIDSSSSNLDLEPNPYEIKPKPKKKKKKDKSGIENLNFKDCNEAPIETSVIADNPYEVKHKEKKKKEVKIILQNLNYGHTQSYKSSIELQEYPYEVKLKKNKRNNKNQVHAIDNPIFNPNDSVEVELSGKVDTLGQTVNPSIPDSSFNRNNLENIEETDLILNIVATPIPLKKRNQNSDSTLKSDSVKRRKSVRFSDVTQELIIPNNEELRRMQETEEENEGIDNVNFNKLKNSLDENLDTISKTIDGYQAEIENDINEKKQHNFMTPEDIMIGEIGNPHGENEKLPEGTKIKFKYAHFDAKTPFYQLDKVGAKKSYKHLIKGDIILKFKNTNLHEIEGYARTKKK